MIGTSPDRPGIAFARVPDYRPPTWPDGPRPQHRHFDVRVSDLDRAEAEVAARRGSAVRWWRHLPGLRRSGRPPVLPDHLSRDRDARGSAAGHLGGGSGRRSGGGRDRPGGTAGPCRRDPRDSAASPLGWPRRPGHCASCPRRLLRRPGAPLLVVSQFTLYADTRKGRRRRGTEPPRARSASRWSRRSSHLRPRRRGRRRTVRRHDGGLAGQLRPVTVILDTDE